MKELWPAAAGSNRSGARNPIEARAFCSETPSAECAAQARCDDMRTQIKLILGALALSAAAPLISAVPRGDEPVAVPTAIKQGIDFVYVDPAMSTVARRKQKPRNWLQRVFGGSGDAGVKAPNPVFTQLSQGLEQYRASWGTLPQTKVAAGPTLKLGAKGKRVAHGTYTLSDLPDGGTHIEFEFALQKVPAIERPLLPLMRKMVRKGNEKAMERLAALLADGQAAKAA